MSLIGSPRGSEVLDTPASGGQQWASPIAAATRDSGQWPDMSFHRPFREGHKPGYPRAVAGPSRSHELAEEAAHADARGQDRGAASGRGYRSIDRRGSMECEL